MFTLQHKKTKLKEHKNRILTTDWFQIGTEWKKTEWKMSVFSTV